MTNTKMTKQEAFTKAYLGLKAQRFQKAYTGLEGCLYRGPNDTKCAFGHLIPDKPYLDSFEGSTLDAFFEGPIRELFTEDCYPSFLTDLQQCHDSAAMQDNSRKQMKINLKRLAEEYSLTIPRRKQ